MASQHCYCSMCRKLSGSAFQTWAPARDADVTWESPSGSLTLQRTSDWASRHTCTDCGTTMTIKYDSQPDHLWLAAGSYTDDNYVFLSSPMTFPEHLYRVIHICELSKPAWYSIPDDGLPRIPHAG